MYELLYINASANDDTSFQGILYLKGDMQQIHKSASEDDCFTGSVSIHGISPDNFVECFAEYIFTANYSKTSTQNSRKGRKKVDVLHFIAITRYCYILYCPQASLISNCSNRMLQFRLRDKSLTGLMDFIFPNLRKGKVIRKHSLHRENRSLGFIETVYQ